MPSRCCVPLCNGNYPTGPKVSLFRFPKDEQLKKKWLAAIQRKNFAPTLYSRVCQLHFEKTDLISEATAFDEKKGELISAPLDIRRLKASAIPSIFTGSLVKTRGKGLRDYHHVEVKKMNKASMLSPDSKIPYQSTWPHFEQRSSLKDSIKNHLPSDFEARGASLLKVEREEEAELEEEGDASLGEKHDLSIMEPDVLLESRDSSYPSPKEAAQAMMPTSSSGSIWRHLKGASEPLACKQPYPAASAFPELCQEKCADLDEEDDDLLFFKSLLPDLRGLPRARKLLLRVKIQELVYQEIELQERNGPE